MVKRTRLAIQCRAANGSVGSYLYDEGKGVPYNVTPVFNSCSELFLWIKDRPNIEATGLTMDVYLVRDEVQMMRELLLDIASKNAKNINPKIELLKQLRKAKTTWVFEDELAFRSNIDNFLRSYDEQNRI